MWHRRLLAFFLPPGAPAALPRFVPALGDLQSAPPYRFTGVWLRNFPVVADYATLQGVCDRYLNVAPDPAVRWQPLTGLVKVQVLHYARMVSDAPGQLPGYDSQNELAFHIPVVRHERRNRVWRPVDVELYSPFLVVDSILSMATGREVIGYPKVLGRFELDDPHRIAVHTSVFEKGHRDEAFEERELLRMTAEGDPVDLPPPDADRIWPWGPIDQLFTADGPFPVTEDLLTLLRRSAAVHEVPAVQRKALRDARDAPPELACHLALVGGRYALDAVHRAGWLPRPRATLREYASLRLLTELGLTTVNGELDVRRPWFADLDMRLIDVRVLHRL